MLIYIRQRRASLISLKDYKFSKKSLMKPKGSHNLLRYKLLKSKKKNYKEKYILTKYV